MAQNKSPLTFDELKEETQRLAAYLSTCAKQPVEIRVQGHAGLAYTHSIEDDGKKHVIPMVLNPACIEKLRTRERAIKVWWGLGAHELAHHLWPAAKFYEKAYAEGFGRLFNLIDDEQNERRGRSEHPEWGEWFQSVMPLAFPKKAVFQGTQALTGGFGEENSWIKPGGFVADEIYIKRFNQFGYFLRRHNSEPNLVKDKTVAAAIALIPAKLKELTKDELFELTRQVHETLCRGINKPKENVKFQNKPNDPTKKEGEADGSEQKSEENEDDDKEGKDGEDKKDGKDDDKKKKKKDKKEEERELKDGEKPEGDPKEDEETEEEKKKREEEEAERKKKEEEAKKKEEEKKKKEEKEKKEKQEKKSWNPKKLLTSKWLLIPLAAFIIGWCTLFSMAGTNFWLQLAFFIGQMALFMLAFVFLRWGAIRAFLAWMKRKALFERIRRLFLRKSVQAIAFPLLAVALGWLFSWSLGHFGTLTTCFVGAGLLYFFVLRRIHKLSIAGALGGVPPPNAWVLRVLNGLVYLATGLVAYALGVIISSSPHTWLGWIGITLVACVAAMLLLACTGGLAAIKNGSFGLGGGMATPGIRAILKAFVIGVFNFFKPLLMLPVALAALLGVGGFRVVKFIFSALWEGIKGFFRVLGMILGAIWKVVGYGLAVAWRYTRWALSIGFRWTFTKIMQGWWFVAPTLKRLWKHTWFRLLVIAAIASAVLMMAYAVLLYVAHINFWLMVALVILLLLLALLAFLFRKRLMKFIINEILQPMPSLMRQFLAPPLDMTTDWFVPVDNVQPCFADQAWLDAHMPEIIALSQQLRPIFASCGFSAIDREDQPDGFDLIDEIELALIGESSIFIDDETVPKPSLHIEFALDCSGSMGFATTSLRAGEKFELGKLMALAVEHAVIGLPGVTARFWGFRGNVIYDCGTPGQRRASGLTYGGGNNDSAMLWHMGQGAARSGKNMKLLLMASDGMPAECSWLSLRNLVLRFEQEGMIPWNFGLDVIETRAFKNFTDLVGQSKPEAIRTFGRSLSGLASDEP